MLRVDSQQQQKKQQQQPQATLPRDRFFQEAREQLPRVGDSLGLLAQDRTNTAALEEIHRCSRNLHQAALQADLGENMEAAYGVEQLAEAILAGVMPCDDEAIQMFQEALQELSSAVRQGESAKSPAKPQAPPSEVSLTVSPELLAGFLEEARDLLERANRHLERVEASGGNRAEVLEVRRAVHTLKGSAAMVGLREVSRLAHSLEDTLDEVHDGTLAWSPQVQSVLHQALEIIAQHLDRTPVPAAPPSAATAPPVRTPETRTEARPASEPAPPPQPAPAPQVRVGFDHLDASLAAAGELSVIRAGWEQQLASQRRQLDELALVVRKCQRIAHRLETDFAGFSPGGIEWEDAQQTIDFSRTRPEFDALEFDRYTEFHLLTRDLAETASDLVTIEAQLASLANEFDLTRGRYARTSSELQERILQMRTAPASVLRDRLARTVLSAAQTLGKQVNFQLTGGDTGLDKAAIEALAAPLEHLLRNAVSHGVEPPEARLAAGKGASGTITVEVARDGSSAVVRVIDDGAGIDDRAVREAAIRAGFCNSAQAAVLSGRALYSLLFEPGFSTAGSLSEISGRGLGLDIVQAAAESLKGTVTVDSTPGAGAVFTLRFPVSQTILRVLMVEAGGETFALPLPNVLRAGKAVVVAVSAKLRQVMLEEVLDIPQSDLSGRRRANRPAVVLDCGAEQIVLLVNRILEIREVLVRPPSGILRKAPTVAGTATLADGRVVLVLQPARLSRPKRAADTAANRVAATQRTRPHPLEILVIDDSVSVRRVVSKTLQDQGWNVTGAKDGLDALEILNAMPKPPDAILVDVEMPRMDGYDFLVALRSEARFEHVPAIMLTSRGGDKHRAKAFEAGVTDFLVKPYVDEVLVATIRQHAAAGLPPQA